MKVAIVFAAVVACAFAAPLQNPADKDAVIIKYDNDNIGVGPYNVE